MKRKESLKNLARFTFETLSTLYPNADIQLKFGNDIQLLVAVMLSAQCTDKRVNQVTEILFKNYKTTEAFAKTRLAELEEAIRPCGLYHSKAKNIISTAEILLQKYGGKVPSRNEDLLELPGVGRKTANVVRSVGFGEPAFAVDTHVKRVARRIGLTRQTDPFKIEQELCQLFSRTQWKRTHHLLIFHGRNLCTARKPLCSHCPLKSRCHYYLKITISG